MSSDSVRPSSLSLRTSRLNDAVSRPSSAARSGARTSGERSMIASVCRVHGPADDAASRRSSRARTSASSASVGGCCRSPIRGSSPAQRRPTRNTGRSAFAASPRRNASSDRGARPAGVVLGDGGLVDGFDGGDLDQPDGGAHPGADDHARAIPTAEAEIDGPGLDLGGLARSDPHRDRLGRVPWIRGDGLRDPDGSRQGGGRLSYRAYSSRPTTQPGAIWARRPRS